MAFDPICGKPVGEAATAPSALYRSRRYYFCSDRCRKDFERAAEKIRLHDALRAGALLSRGKVKWGVA